MPTYDMRCKKCGSGFEIALSFAEKDKKAACPECASRDLEQVYSSHILLRKNRGTCAASCSTCDPSKCGR